MVVCKALTSISNQSWKRMIWTKKKGNLETKLLKVRHMSRPNFLTLAHWPPFQNWHSRVCVASGSPHTSPKRRQLSYEGSCKSEDELGFTVLISPRRIESWATTIYCHLQEDKQVCTDCKKNSKYMHLQPLPLLQRKLLLILLSTLKETTNVLQLPERPLSSSVQWYGSWLTDPELEGYVWLSNVIPIYSHPCPWWQTNAGENLQRPLLWEERRIRSKTQSVTLTYISREMEGELLANPSMD